jgi:hypothetical protein
VLAWGAGALAALPVSRCRQGNTACPAKARELVCARDISCVQDGIAAVPPRSPELS